MKKIEKQVGGLKRRLRDRRRSVNRRTIAIATASRHKGPPGEEKRKKEYKDLLRLSRQILNDTKRVMVEVEEMSPAKKRAVRRWSDHASRRPTCGDRCRRAASRR